MLCTLTHPLETCQLDCPKPAELPRGIDDIQPADARNRFVIGIRRSLPKPRLVTLGPGGA